MDLNSSLNTLEKALEIGGKLLPSLLAFGSEAQALIQRIGKVLLEVDDKEIRCIHSVKTALHNLVLVVERAYAFLDKVDDAFYYCQCDSMAAAREGLNCSPPNLKLLRDLMGQLGNSLAQAGYKHSEFKGACEAASRSCGEAAAACAHKVQEYQKKKNATRGVGGTAAGVALAGGTAAAAGGVVATGVVVSAIAGAFTFGIGTIVGLGITAAAVTGVGLAGVAAGVGTAVVTGHIASKYKKSEDAFRRICRDFDTLESFAYDLSEKVAEVHTTLENISTQVDYVRYGIHQSSTNLMKDSMKRLNMVCEASYGKSSTIREDIKSKTETLKGKFNRVYSYL